MLDDVDALNNKGNALEKLGKYVGATNYYEKAIKVLKSNQSNHPTSYSRLASTVIPIYRYIAATRTSDPQNTIQDQNLIVIQLNYAKSLANIGDYHLAIMQYNAILQSDPYNGCVLLANGEP
ncbi:MAG: tetratricopeptide repeat protein [Candidatus Nitrosopolaris sp.]